MPTESKRAVPAASLTWAEVEDLIEAEREHLAERLWLTGTEPETCRTWESLTDRGRARWRRVAAEAIQWSIER